MVFLLQLFHLYVQFVLLADSLRTGVIVAGVNMMVALHLVEEHTLAFHQLAVDGKEGGSLFRRQSGFGSNKLLQFGLKPLWVEPLVLLCLVSLPMSPQEKTPGRAASV